MSAPSRKDQERQCADSRRHQRRRLSGDPRSLPTNNPLERLIREIKRRTKVAGSFPDGNSALMLVAARLRYVTGTKWEPEALSGYEPPQGA